MVNICSYMVPSVAGFLGAITRLEYVRQLLTTPVILLGFYGEFIR